MTEKKKRSISAYSILLLIIIALAAVTWFVPGVEKATLATIVMAPYNGFVNAIDVCVFVLVLGGFLGVVTKTGALDAGIKTLVKKLNGNELILIPILMCVFALGGTTYGMCEETVAFYALISATMVAAGFDTIVAAATILLGAGIGCLGSTVNPFATGIASSALVDLGVPVDQSVIMILGFTLLVANLAIAIWYVMRYAKKVKNEKGSILSTSEKAAMMEHYSQGDHEKVTFTGKQKFVLVIFAFVFIVMIISVMPWADLIGESAANAIFGWSAFLNGVALGGWWFGELAMWFFLATIIVGILGGLHEKVIVESFVSGAADIVSVVLIIAVARGASVLMTQTGLDIYLLTAAANALNGLSATIFAPLAYLVYIGLSFLIPSTSGCATVTMPIMGPLTASLGYNPAVMVMIFAAASGVVNLFTPTSGVVMGGLSIAKVEYSTWLKWAGKLILILAVVSCVILTVAMTIL
ncbi:YfcC family protein [Anaerorhabdus sp.]|nr:YfcC family protein [Anaerorhabdus sp.]MEA4874240.1 YfcC family protein [Anaerorhabdus sp.]